MSYLDKFGKDDKELREKMEKVVKSVVSTVIEQYSSDSFLKSLNDTLNKIFEKSPVIN
jgi:lipoate-protein ligase A